MVHRILVIVGVVVLLVALVGMATAFAWGPNEDEGDLWSGDGQHHAMGGHGLITLDTHGAMHEACEAGDVQGMTDAMDSLTDEDWAAMEEHMSDGHHEAMGSGMMAH